MTVSIRQNTSIMFYVDNEQLITIIADSLTIHIVDMCPMFATVEAIKTVTRIVTAYLGAK
jgi:hypothetical protein